MRQRRPKGSKPGRSITDIKREVAVKQLAAIGALALAYNEVEGTLERLFFSVTDLPDYLQLEVSTRIGGVDGTLEIINRGAEQILDPKDARLLQDCLGDGGFKHLKNYRDGVIHVRNLNVARGIGTKIDRRAAVFDYLVRQDALDAAYDILVAMQKELNAANLLILGMKELRATAADDPKKLQHGAAVKAAHTQFLQRRAARLALPPIPEFPSDSELRAADLKHQQAQQAAYMGWYQEWDRPSRPRLPPWLEAATYSVGTPLALHHSSEEKKK